ncbi:sensor histidine kinase [Sphingomonas sp. SUN039]|uniref:sensor histidine kinase n=1 Tax=Sphingomonas sp. SUN039 TaxID=2937787 RepID=UPI002164BEF6|nr:histidine kinase dimerization/phosphoacceptor domain -containing protein [Sphingomonas sp. SUN039]UVO54449.1 histidine kinase [Sphingomonas sp. SUN039]
MQSGSRRGWTAAFTRLSTSQKLILVLSLALMPLGAIALIASLQSARTADAQRRADVQVATTEAARKLGAELTSDIVALRTAADALDSTFDSREACARLNALLATNPLRHVPVALFGPASTPLCASRRIPNTRPYVALADTRPVLRRSGDTLDIVVPSARGSNVAIARYSAKRLYGFARPSGLTLPYRMTLDADDGMIDLADTLGTAVIPRYESATVPVGIDALALTMTVPAAPFGATEALLALLPILMWAAAVIVGYYVVDRFLVRPLKALRAAVGSYEPGSSRLILSATPATEIRELETSFTAFADRLADRERDLEKSLADQVKLTREVHHRVKNNLQVIASLISLHARSTVGSEAQRAYAAIQRRVDALAIVHRNHFAELEKNLGIDVKSLIGELVANFRANAAQGGSVPVVTVAAAALTVSQDTAMPIAFLFTEITEMALFTDPGTAIAIEAVEGLAAGTARLSISATSLAERITEGNEASLRIVDALARQLRSSLDYDAATGRYAIGFPIIEPFADD